MGFIKKKETNTTTKKFNSIYDIKKPKLASMRIIKYVGTSKRTSKRDS